MTVYRLLVVVLLAACADSQQPLPVGINPEFYAINEKAAASPEAAATISNSVPYYSQPYQEAASSGYAHHHHPYPYAHSGWPHSSYGFSGIGHSHPGVYGHGDVGSSNSLTMNTSSAVGLLGFVALLTLIQNALGQIMNTSSSLPVGRRRKRDEAMTQPLEENAPLTSITSDVLPLMEQYAVKQGRHLQRLQCILRRICQASKNSSLDRKLNRLVWRLIFRCTAMIDMDQNLRKQMALASETEQHGVNCSKVYPYCASSPP